MSSIPENFLDLFDKRTFAHLATLMPDGSPQVSAVWIDRDGDHVIVNSAEGRVKDENMRNDSRVALSMLDPENPYRTLMLRGKVVEITKDGADEHIDKMAMKYLGKEKYPFRGKDEVRVIYRIEIESHATMP